MARSKEYLISPCVQYKNSKFLGFSHDPIIERIVRIYDLPANDLDDPEGTERGFLTNGREFVSRERALKIAVRSRQVRKDALSIQFGGLYSDDFLWKTKKKKVT